MILSSWFLALVLFGLVFLAGTAIGAAFSSSKAPATTLSQQASHGKGAMHGAHAHGQGHQGHRHNGHKHGEHAQPTHLTKAEEKQAKLEEWYAHADANEEALKAEKSKLGKKSPAAKAKATAAVSNEIPRRISTADARQVFDERVNPQRNKKNLVDIREQAAKKTILAPITQNQKVSKVAAALGHRKLDFSKVASDVVGKTGHSYTPVKHRSKALQHNPEAPTVMEIAAQQYVHAFDGVSTADLLRRAHDNLFATEKFEVISSQIDVDTLADALYELDSAPSGDSIAKIVTSEIFSDTATKHPWESARKSRKLLGGATALAEKGAGSFAQEFEQALGLENGKTLVDFLPSVAEQAPQKADEITLKGDDASDEERILAAVYDLTAVCARSAPAPIGKNVPAVFKPAWAVLIEALKEVDASSL